MPSEKINIVDMGRVLFSMMGGIRTQNGRITKGLLDKITEQEVLIKKLEEENDNLRKSSQSFQVPR